MEDEKISQNLEDDSSDIISIYVGEAETVHISQTEAENFFRTLFVEDLYTKYFVKTKYSSWNALNRVFCCQSISALEAIQKDRKDVLLQTYARFVQESNRATSQQEKTEIRQKYGDIFLNFENSYDKKDDESGNRQHVQALLLLFLFYLQQVALILIGDVQYPEDWENTVIWLKKMFLPDIRINLSVSDSAALHAAFYSLVIVVHLSIYITFRTVMIASIHYYSGLKTKQITMGIGKFLQYKVFPSGIHRGENKDEIAENFTKNATKFFAFLSLNLITPLGSIILNLFLEENEIVFKIIFSSIGILILIMMFLFYWRLSQGDKNLWELGQSFRVINLFEAAFESYRKGYKWLKK
eukprot:snap_masked-scaffold_8-processed-gene-14.29-mRNA-1 protein AED:1.00 eAED:1.00 QI:0/0/0/0/1/1/4/0/353